MRRRPARPRRRPARLELYTTPLSANGRKVLAVSHHLGLAPEIHEVDVYRGEGRTPEFLAIHPAGKIPVLVDGDLVLSESNAILLYLSEAHGRHRLWSKDPKRRADVVRWMFWESAHWQPACIGALAPLVGHRLRPDLVPPPAAEPDWDGEAIGPLLGALEAHLADRRFLAGAELTLADFAVAGMTTYFGAARFPFARFPAFEAWCRRIEALDAWHASAAPLWSAAQ